MPREVLVEPTQVLAAGAALTSGAMGILEMASSPQWGPWVDVGIQGS